MSRFDEIRKLAESQFRKIKQDIGRNPEIRKLADAQFFDMANEDHIAPRILSMPESNRSNWTHLDTREKMIYVLKKSLMFSDEEIAKFCGTNRMYIWRLIERLNSGDERKTPR